MPHISIDTQNTIKMSDSQKIIATIGIDSQDALLFCAKSREQEVKTVVSQLQCEGGNRWI